MRERGRVTLRPSNKISITNKSLKRIWEKKEKKRTVLIAWLPWAAARRRMLLFAPETRALWDLVAGLRLLVGVLPSGVPLPLSFSLSTLSLSLAPEGGIASNICSMLENPGAQIEADLVFRRRELSDIFPAILPRFPLENLSDQFLPTSLSLFLSLYPPCNDVESLQFFLKKKKTQRTRLLALGIFLSIHFQFIVSLLLFFPLIEVSTWRSGTFWFTFSSLLERETTIGRRKKEISRRDDFLGEDFWLFLVSKNRGRGGGGGCFRLDSCPPSRDWGRVRLKVSTRWERVERFVEKSLRLWGNSVRAKVRTLWRSNMWRVPRRGCSLIVNRGDALVCFKTRTRSRFKGSYDV